MHLAETYKKAQRLHKEWGGFLIRSGVSNTWIVLEEEEMAPTFLIFRGARSYGPNIFKTKARVWVAAKWDESKLPGYVDIDDKAVAAAAVRGAQQLKLYAGLVALKTASDKLRFLCEHMNAQIKLLNGILSTMTKRTDEGERIMTGKSRVKTKEDEKFETYSDLYAVVTTAKNKREAKVLLQEYIQYILDHSEKKLTPQKATDIAISNIGYLLGYGASKRVLKLWADVGTLHPVYGDLTKL